jgi:hypothetical protein
VGNSRMRRWVHAVQSMGKHGNHTAALDERPFHRGHVDSSGQATHHHGP